ncbi:MAG: hypothetical protein LBV50_07260 [Novosphingobium sp.]|jgi:hypothetical protein|nr:hypothetical protein [Novosphingobium sp.]
MWGIRLAAIAAAAGIPEVAWTQPIQAIAPEAATTVLPRNTRVMLSLNQTLDTRNKSLKAGDTFTLTVDRNVMLGRAIVIPRGSKAVGSVTWRTGKGVYGKSGKMEISLDYIELGDRQIPIEGTHREEAEGNTNATVATALFISVLGAGFITGHSAQIRAGQIFTAWTKEDLPVVLPAPVAMPSAVPFQNTASVPMPSAAPVPFGNGHVRCITCR